MKRALVFAAILVVAAAAFLLLRDRATAPVNEEALVATSTVPGLDGWKNYESDKLGVKFLYPNTYLLKEEGLDTVNRYHARVTLAEEEVREGPPREGPVSITVDVYQNNLDRQSPESWAKGSNDSNFKLSNGILASTTLGGLEGVGYRYSGLYEANAIVVGDGDRLYMFTVNYLTPEDKIVEDFAKLIATVRFD